MSQARTLISSCAKLETSSNMYGSISFLLLSDVLSIGSSTCRVVPAVISEPRMVILYSCVAKLPVDTMALWTVIFSPMVIKFCGVTIDIVLLSDDFSI